jgi:hypothetical protein
MALNSIVNGEIGELPPTVVSSVRNVEAILKEYIYIQNYACSWGFASSAKIIPIN